MHVLEYHKQCFSAELVTNDMSSLVLDLSLRRYALCGSILIASVVEVSVFLFVCISKKKSNALFNTVELLTVLIFTSTHSLALSILLKKVFFSSSFKT